MTKDRDIGALVHRDRRPYAGVLLIDDLGDPAAEAALIVACLDSQQEALENGVFVRVAGGGVSEIVRQ